MKCHCVFALVFLFGGVCSVSAQNWTPKDFIVPKNINSDWILAEVIKVTETEIYYRRFVNDKLEGSIRSIPLHTVRYIRYKDGSYVFFKIEPPDVPLNIGINVNGGGLIPLGNKIRSGGPSVNVEFIKKNFYSLVNLSIPIQHNVGFGFSGIFNYLWNSKIGDFYLGGGLGYTYHTYHFFTFGVSAGYRFVTSFGMYFGAGAYIGGKINNVITLDIKPILGIGYVF